MGSLHLFVRITRLAAILIITASLGGCYVPCIRTADLSHFQIDAASTDIVSSPDCPADPPTAPGTHRMLVVGVLGSGVQYQTQPIPAKDRSLLTERLGQSPALELLFASSDDLGAQCTPQSISALAAHRRADWLLITSADSQSRGPSMAILLTVLTLGITPFDVSCDGSAEAALFDVPTRRLLAHWTHDDSGWQIAHITTAAAARDQMINRTNHRMEGKIGRELAALLTEVDPALRSSAQSAKARLDGWGGDQ